MDRYIARVGKGETLTIVRRSKPIFKLSPPNGAVDSGWETVVDFTKINRNGVLLKDVLARL